MTVKWTLHDCWAFTGHCTHFDYIGCNRWKTGCAECPQKKRYPSSYLVDRSCKNYQEKKELYTKGDMNPIEDMQTVSYNSVIGKYVYHLPYMGYAGAFFSTFPGRLMLVMIGSIGLMLTAYAKPEKRSE